VHDHAHLRQHTDQGDRQAETAGEDPLPVLAERLARKLGVAWLLRVNQDPQARLARAGACEEGRPPPCQGFPCSDHPLKIASLSGSAQR
jgi:hypothetical protein